MKIAFTPLWNGLLLLLLVHSQSLQSCSCQFIYLNKTSVCFVCVPSKRIRVLLLWQIKQSIWIQLNPLFAKSFICKPKQLQNPHCSGSICWAGQWFLPANLSVTLVSSIMERTPRESPRLHTSHPLPARNLFPVAKLVPFHTVSIVPASFTLFPSPSSLTSFFATLSSCLYHN